MDMYDGYSKRGCSCSARNNLATWPEINLQLGTMMYTTVLSTRGGRCRRAVPGLVVMDEKREALLFFGTFGSDGEVPRARGPVRRLLSVLARLSAGQMASPYKPSATATGFTLCRGVLTFRLNKLKLKSKLKQTLKAVRKLVQGV